jgi:hypothetical protein
MFVLSTATFAQDGAKKVPPGVMPPGVVEVRFTDGGNLRMTIAEEFLELATAHGKLKIAVADIRRLELATRISESTRQLIERSIDNLGSPQFKLREKATADLLALREKAYSDVLKVAQSSQPEVAKRAKDVLEKIRAKVPPQRLRTRDKDLVFTADSTISGRLELASLNATTTQFGQVKLNLTDLAVIYFLASGAETELKLDGKYALNDEAWLDTQLDVNENTRLSIMASGEIDMYATGGYTGQYVGTPKGKKQWPGSNGLMYEPGTLIARVGETGKVFVVKDQYEDYAPATGRLYLRAAGNPYNVTTTGHYTIQITGGVPGGAAIAAPKSDPVPEPKGDEKKTP